jgi:aminoglycoside phosphotransferase (APT) family kinase protein
VNIFPLINDPAFVQQAETAIRLFCKEVHEVTYIEHGTDNIVALANKEYVFHFPRNADAAKRLTFETALLQKVGKKVQAVSVPGIVKVQMQPLYVVSQYIPGEHLTSAQIQSLSEDEQIAIGRTIAAFIAQLSQSISSLEVQRLRTEAAADSLREPWDIYFKRLFVTEQLPNNALRPIVDHYYQLWEYYAKQEQQTYAIHDDLHVDNLLFLGPRLSGIVDFSETNVGSVEEEMRWLYAMSDIVLKSAIAHYQELTGTVVDYDHVRIWVVTQQLASFVKRLTSQETESPHFKRAQENLRKWIPSFPL